MTTGATLTGAMLTASIVSIQAKLDRAQLNNMGTEADFNTFFEEAQVKNELTQAEGEAIEAGATAAAEAKRKTEELAVNYSSVSAQHDAMIAADYSNTSNLTTLSNNLNDDAYWEYLDNNPKKKEELGMQVAAGILEDGVVDAQEQQILDSNPRLNNVFQTGLQVAIDDPERYIAEHGQEAYDNAVKEVDRRGGPVKFKETLEIETAALNSTESSAYNDLAKQKEEKVKSTEQLVDPEEEQQEISELNEIDSLSANSWGEMPTDGLDLEGNAPEAEASENVAVDPHMLAKNTDPQTQSVDFNKGGGVELS